MNCAPRLRPIKSGVDDNEREPGDCSGSSSTADRLTSDQSSVPYPYIYIPITGKIPSTWDTNTPSDGHIGEPNSRVLRNIFNLNLSDCLPCRGRSQIRFALDFVTERCRDNCQQGAGRCCPRNRGMPRNSNSGPRTSILVTGSAVKSIPPLPGQRAVSKLKTFCRVFLEPVACLPDGYTTARVGKPSPRENTG